MNVELLKFCTGKGILVDKVVLEALDSIGDEEIAKNILEKIVFQFNQKIITKGFFKDNQHQLRDLLSYHSKDKKILIKKAFFELGVEEVNFSENKGKNNEIKKISLEPKVELLKIYQNTPRKLVVKDFVNNFKNRFNSLKSILQERSSLDNLISISRIYANKGNFSIICLVGDKKMTKNGNVMLQIEDLSGRTTAIITKNREEVFEKSKELILDEVVGLKCSGNGEMVFVNDIFFPDAKITGKKTSTIDESVAFISDIHVGSDKFLEKNFIKFLEWLNGGVGDEAQRVEALKIKYLFITGDTIDGVGVYPGQETQLLIKDVDEQYDYLVGLLSLLRKDLKIIMCAGQHDAVRVAEPQPIIGEYYGQALKKLDNLYLVTNPSLIGIGAQEQFKILMYHGASMHGVINSIDELRINKAHNSPTSVVKHLLKKRHLAPTHSLVTYTPFKNEDPLMIKEIPDILATGDLHRPEIANYNGILLIASSCWQARTPFEEKVGNNPDPCKVPVFNLKTREIKILDFSGEMKE